MGFAVTLIATPIQQRDALLNTAGVTVTDTVAADFACPVSAGQVADHFVTWRNMRASVQISSVPDRKPWWKFW